MLEGVRGGVGGEGAPEDDAACAALAHFALETVNLARGQADPRQTVHRAFDLLERGWPAAAHGPAV